jgi:hypothetical protein
MPEYLRRMGRPLEIAACRSACAWDTTGEHLDDEPLFACSGCGSEWVPSEPWTPIDWTGRVPEPVQRAARERRGRGWQTGQK